MRTRISRLGLSLVAAAATVAALAQPAAAIRDPGPIIVCVTEPCPGVPSLPDLP